MSYQVEGKLLVVCTWQGRTLRLRLVQGRLARMFTSLKEG
jgi:hypothetical protein